MSVFQNNQSLLFFFWKVLFTHCENDKKDVYELLQLVLTIILEFELILKLSFRYYITLTTHDIKNVVDLKSSD